MFYHCENCKLENPELSELANPRCDECGGLGFTIGFCSNEQTEHLCQSCFVKFDEGDKVQLLCDIVVEHGGNISYCEGKEGECGTIECIDSSQWDIANQTIQNIQYCVRLERGNLVCVFDSEIQVLNLDYLVEDS